MPTSLFLIRRHIREALIASAALSLGCVATLLLTHARPVHAAAEPALDLGYQFQNIGPQSALTLYNPADHTLTVYQGATAGNAQISCSFQYRITRPGAPIERKNCQPGSLLP